MNARIKKKTNKKTEAKEQPQLIVTNSTSMFAFGKSQIFEVGP